MFVHCVVGIGELASEREKEKREKPVGAESIFVGQIKPYCGV